MFSIFSWARQRSLEPLIVALACSVLASVALAETANVRLGAHFRDVIGRPLQRFDRVSEVLERINLGVPLFVPDVDNCQDLAEIPVGKEHGYDTLRNTYTIIQSIKVECWAVLQIDPNAKVTKTGPADQITPAMIHGIMAHAEKLSAGNEEWLKTLTTFPGGVITCKDEERCLLSLPDGKNPPDYAVEFELIMAKGEERFIMVTQLYRWQAGFVYGVHWRDSGGEGEVVSIFPDLD